MKSIILRIIVVFVVINYLWGLIPVQTLPELLQIIFRDFLGPLVIFGLFITVSLKWLWRIPFIGYLFRWIFDTNPPLYGCWAGKIEYEFENLKQIKNAFLVIKQPDALTINVLFYTDERISISEIASIIIRNGQKNLIYTYKTEDMINNKKKNPPHTGTVVLRIDTSQSDFKLSGDYYTTRQTVGTMFFSRKSKKIVDSYNTVKKICKVL